MDTAPHVIHAQNTNKNATGKPPPPCFAEVFVRNGWRGMELAYGSRTTINRRWIAELGDKELLAARRAYRVKVKNLRLGIMPHDD